MQARTISTHGPSVGGTVVSKNLHLKSRNRVVVRSGPINPDIRKEEAKVVDTVDVSEQDKKQVAYCRCWRSKTFPMCDGTSLIDVLEPLHTFK